MLPPSRTHLWILALLYGVTLVYLNLIPLDFSPLPLDEWSRRAMAMPWLKLGLASRADWVANLLMAAPFGFLVASALGAPSSKSLANNRLSAYDVSSIAPTRASRLAAILLGGPVVVALILAIEIVQILFPQRTVSLNDLVAGWLGGAIGILAWMMAGERLWRLAWEAAHPNRRTLLAGIGLYTLAYAALSLFPYDFILNAGELTDKFNTVHLGFMSESCSSAARCAASVLAEILAVVPLGVGLALWRDGPISGPRGYLLALVVGALFGLMIEFLQIFVYSGISQGLSVMTRALGVALGWALSGWLFARPLEDRHFQLRPWALWALPPYVLAVFVLNGLATARWGGWDTASKQMSEARFMPFYFHYFTTETAAMASLIGVFGLFLPVGFAIWPWQARFQHPFRIAVIAGATLAAVVEASKLFTVGLHPDPTNVLVAAVGAWSGLGLLNWLVFALRARTDGRTGVSQPSALSAHVMPAPPTPRPHAGEGSEGLADVRHGGLSVLRALSIMLSVLVVGLAVTWPVGAPVLALGLTGYGVVLWRRRALWFFVVPALLPVLDLSPLTGRLLLDECDLLVLITLAVGYWRVYGVRPLPWPNRWFPIAIALLWATWAVATARGLWPLLGWEGGLADSSHSPLDAWMVGKGLLWALLLVSLVRRVPLEKRDDAQRGFLNGLIAGLVIVTLVVFWERHVFVGLGDFENEFRVTATFASMNTGGAYIEAFIAFAFPVLAVWVLGQRRWAPGLAGLFAVALASYAMLVTFSRGGYAGLVAGLGLVAWGTLWPRAGPLRRRGLALAGLAVVVIAVAVPVLSGGFAQYRLARAADDLAIREAHWARALGLMDGGAAAALLGMGFGQYPIRYLFGASAGKPPGTFSVPRDGDNPFLRLGAGEAVFLDQRVDVERGERYTLSARVRRPDGGGTLMVALCVKALLYSFECSWHRLDPGKPADGWSAVLAEVDAGNLGNGGNWPHRPVTMSLHNSGGGPVDVDDVSLRAADGRQLLANGDFSAGVKRWLFVADQDPAWHIHQQWVELYFAQGVLGVVAMVVLLIGVAAVLGPAMVAGNPRAIAFAAALASFLTVGLLGSTLDTARLSMLFYLGAFCGGFLTCWSEGGRVSVAEAG